MASRFVYVTLYLLFAFVQAMGSTSNPDSSFNQPLATWPLHENSAEKIGTLLINDAVLHHGTLNQKLVERSAFYYTYIGILKNEVTWPDENSTTCQNIVTVEHFLDPSLPHKGWGPSLNAGQKCNEYFGIASYSWEINIVYGIIWFSRALHFVQDLCMPSHGDPDWSYAGGDMATQWIRVRGHQAGEDAVCRRVLTWSEFDSYKKEDGLYNITDPHGGMIAPLSWVDRNAHAFSHLRPYCDGIGGIFGTDDDYDMV